MKRLLMNALKISIAAYHIAISPTLCKADPPLATKTKAKQPDPYSLGYARATLRNEVFPNSPPSFSSVKGSKNELKKISVYLEHTGDFRDEMHKVYAIPGTYSSKDGRCTLIIKEAETRGAYLVKNSINHFSPELTCDASKLKPGAYSTHFE